MAYQLNNECLNPQPIEKTKVSLATLVFSESTRNAMQHYIENGDGFAHWEGTLNFLNINAKWWDILNVKTPSKSKCKRHNDFEKISKDNLETITIFFTNIVHWIDQWKTSEKPGLTNQTFNTFKQTSTTTPLLAEYLLAEMRLEYVPTGKFQSDFLEMRFGRYRQLNGANYFATERQFLQAEKAIRVKSLIKFPDYSIKDVQAIMKKDTLVCESTSHTWILLLTVSRSKSALKFPVQMQT